MKKIAVFPGSFDPVTKGHVAIVKRALPMFDKIIVAVGVNTSKNRMFDLEQRLEWLKAAFEGHETIEIEKFEGLTVDFCKQHHANFILRGLRNTIDFEYEKSIAQMNKGLNSELETVFLYTDPEYSAISSTIIREIIKSKGDASQFLPDQVKIQ